MPVSAQTGAVFQPFGGLPLGCNGPIRALAALPDGRLAIGGRFSVCGDAAVRNLAVFDPQSGHFQALGSGTVGEVSTLATTATKLYVGGSFSSIGGINALNLASLNLATQVWQPVHASLFSQSVNALQLVDTQLYVGGNFPAGRNLQRLDTDTGALSAVGVAPNDGVNATVNALAFDAGFLFVAGEFSQAGTVNVSSIARFKPNDQSWAGLGKGVSGSVNALSIAADGDLYVGGQFNVPGVTASNGIARYRPSSQSWFALLDGGVGGVDASVRCLLSSGPYVYVGGDFRQAANLKSPTLVRWHTSLQTWEGVALPSDSFAPVRALAVAGPKIWVGGDFSRLRGTAAASLLSLDPQTNSPAATHDGTGLGTRDLPRAFAAIGERLFVAGIQLAGEVQTAGIGQFDRSTRVWSALGSGLDGQANALAVDGPRLFVGGSFSSAGGNPARGLAVWNDQTQAWENLPALPSALSIEQLLVNPTELIVAGQFNETNGQFARVMRLDRNTQVWTSLGAQFRDEFTQPAFFTGLTQFNGQFHVSGSFTQIGGSLIRGVARFNTSTGNWQVLASGSPWSTLSTLQSITAAGDALYLAGAISINGTIERVARWRPSVPQLSALGSGLTGNVVALAADQAGLFVFGPITSAGGLPAQNFARWDLSNSTWSAPVPGVGELDSATAMGFAGTQLLIGGAFGRVGVGVSSNLGGWGAEADSIFGDRFE